MELERCRTLFDFGILRARSDGKCESRTASVTPGTNLLSDVATCTPQEGVSHSELCNGVCCQPGSSGPNQPRDRATVGTQNRSVNSCWFRHYEWLTLCKRRNVLFCYSCMQANGQKLITFSKRSDDAFITVGFSAWKNALTRFAKHESSDTHR